jgi:metal-responsive CopG/Arc/MetJ family transcriptional regulator
VSKLPTISVTLNTAQAQLVEEASQAVHGKPAREAIRDFIRFTVREHRRRQAREQAEAEPDIWELQ